MSKTEVQISEKYIKFIVENQIVVFDIEKIQKLKKIGVAFSSGTDSSLIFCLLAKYIPHIEIIPWYGIEFHQIAGLDFVKNAYKKIVNNYPNANIAPMRYFGIDKKDPIWIKTFFNHENYVEPLDSNIKNFILDQFKEEYISVGITNVNTFGTLMAPPKSECDKYGFTKYVEPRRWEANGNEWSMIGVKIWQPLKFVNKKFVAGMFKKEGLMDWLYPHLNSCAGRDPIKTNNFTKPCKNECFHCYERKWGFGTYDGGLYE